MKPSRHPLLAMVALLSACVSVPFDAPAGPGAGEGTLSVEPASLAASEEARLRLIFTAGPSGLADGGGFRVQVPVDPVHPFLGFTPPQSSSRVARGFVRCLTRRGDREGADAVAVAQPGGVAGCALAGGRLHGGESLVMEYWTLAPRVARRWRLPAESRVTGGEGGRSLAAFPALQVTSRPARVLEATTPSLVAAGAPMPLTLVALDEFGNLDGSYDGTVGITLGSERVERRFSPADAGVLRWEAPAPGTDGFARFEVQEIGVEPDLALRTRSNPARVLPAGDPEAAARGRVLWGDLHFHTGDGAAGAAFLPPSERAGDRRGNDTDEREAYTWARDVAQLDFAAATEYATRPLTDEAWRRCLEAAAAFDDPPRFTTFVGYEWLDRLVLSPGGAAPLARSDDRLTDEPGELVAALAPLGDPGAFLVRLPGGPDRHDPPVDALEIYSWRNRGAGYENRPRRYEPSAPDPEPGLALVAGSASHWGRPGTIDRTGLEPGAGGLTAVVARANDRAAILAAFRRGDAWATTGTRLYLRVARVSGGLRIEAAAPAPLKSVDLIVVDGTGRHETALLPAGAAELVSTVPPPRAGSDGFWYVRARDEDGGFAWSAPRPLDREGAP